jgi:hypothetical protein
MEGTRVLYIGHYEHPKILYDKHNNILPKGYSPGDLDNLAVRTAHVIVGKPGFLP